ncbi:GNAT family N-acetyltransferase [Desulfuribacillus alkaliarsenatis]|uniref:N-acetyltransferase domain-containing protein n=1 Tax=Desulfuribacillus alkaliarsenatis TaxID=766136 RepID=A0A1E5G3S3_9FIRM|nr:GNAT family N-acetyltransferase [Desulfuribacillus alkaliarsenatis]OEF97727.1 hypothetical protein BHF68_14105 [Desulfuribacillus alkaliarsenatis]
MITIRNIEKEDKQQVLELIEIINQQDNLGYSLTDEWFEYVIKEAGEHIFVALDTTSLNCLSVHDSDKHQVVGLATCMIDSISKQSAQINIIIHPAYRKRGTGTALYNKIIQHIEPYPIVRLEAIAKKRLKQSVSFMENRKFKPAIYSWQMELGLTNVGNIKSSMPINQKIQLRPATELDFFEYRETMHSCFSHEISHIQYEQIFKDLSIKLYFYEMIEPQYSQGKIVVGMIAMQIRRNVSTGYLFDIAIKEAYRGNGYGRQMICEALNNLKQMNMHKAALIVEGTNKKALSLYSNLGFVIVDEDIIMEKMIVNN